MSTVISEVNNKNNNQTDTCDLLLHYLEQLGVEYVFGIPGGAIEPLYNALARSEKRGGIRAITARHETGAVFMADAYARNTGKLGVCCSTTGPGATNMITGIASSYENNTPLLIITPQTSQDKIGKKAMQESGDTGVDIAGMLKFCTKFSSYVSHEAQFVQKLTTAIMTSCASPKGPSHLSIPADILKSHLYNSEEKPNFSNLMRQPIYKDGHATNELIEKLSKSKKTVFVVGAGAKEASDLIQKCINNLDALFVATPDGKSLVNPYHPSYRGVIGFAGHQSANKALNDESVDTVLVIGTSLGEFTSNAWDKKSLLNNKLIHIDDNENNFTRSAVAKLQVGGNILAIFKDIVDSQSKCAKDRIDHKFKHIKSLVDRADFFKNKQYINKKELFFDYDEPDKVNDVSAPLKPQYLMHHLTSIFPANTHYLADTGNNLAWAIHYLNPFDRRLNQRRDSYRNGNGRRTNSAGLLQVCAEFCSMGWSIGSSIGTALAHPNDPVVCIVGDGSFLMSGQEITVALQEKLNVIFLIVNDQHLGMVKHGQQLNNSEDTANQLPNIGYALMAASMGIMSHTIEAPEDLEKLNIKSICNRNGPTLIDVKIDPNEVPPIATRIKGMN